MTNLLIMPVIVPLITAIILIFLRKQIMLQRIITLCTLAFVVIVTVVLLNVVLTDGIIRLDFSGWLPPYGILFVGDMFALLLVATAAIVTFIAVLYAWKTIGIEREKLFFYPLVLFMFAGISGSFLTGDIFNLYVCFEVMLLASYALIAMGGERVQLRESLKYALINVLASWFFLVALAYLYGVLGTLNMAHIAQRVAEVGQEPLLTVVALVFLVVFALKAGLLLFFWLPGSYRVPPTAIAALFAALLTKVGIYALYRTFTLMFPLAPEVTHKLIGIMAVATLVLGSMGAIAAKDIRNVATYNVLISVGFILVALAINNEAAFEGATYYIMHDMIAKAMLFLILGTVVYLTGEIYMERMSGLIRNYPVFGWSFFIVLCSLVGIPPLSGFIGKVLIGQGAVASGHYILLGMAFFSSLAVLYSLLKVFLTSFFGETIITIGEEKPLPKMLLVPIILLGALTLGLGLGAEVLAPYVKHAAHTLANPQIYIDAVLQKNM